MHHIRHSRRAAGLLATASASALLFATPAFAQDAPAAATPGAAATAPDAESNTGVEDIVVTAQFRQQRLQDTPIAITAVTAAAIEAKSQTNLQQVADQAPNVSIRPQGGSFGPSVVASIRGAGQNDFNPAFEPGVGIYIDDVYYPQLTGAIFDLLDVERVEILRGPQGTLTGRNSEGGAIKFYSKKPTGESGGYVEGTYGTRNRIGLRAAADFKITDNLFGRISGVYKEQEGYVKRIDYGCAFPTSGIPATTSGNCTLSKLGGVGYQAIRGILRWAPDDKLDVTVIGDYTRDEHTIAGEVLLATQTVDTPNTNVNGVPYDSRFICGRFCNYLTTGQPAAVWKPGLQVAPGVFIDPLGAAGTQLQATSGSDRSDYKGWGVSANITYNLTDDFQLTSITGYRKFDTTFYTDDDLAPPVLNFGRNFLKNHSFSQELRLNAKFGDAIDATLGGYYFTQDSVYDSFQDIRYVPVFPLQFRQPDPTSAEAKAVFANVSFKATDRLTITGGVRYTDESKEQTYFRFNLDGTINRFVDPVGAVYGQGYSGADTRDYNFNGNTTETVAALTGFTAKYQADRVDYRVAVDYRFSDAFLAYGSVSTGFKGGGTNPRPFNAGQVLPFDPETVTAYEIGFKSDFLDRRVRLNGAVFQNNYGGLQIPVLACPDSPCAARLNAGDARVRGFELELNARPTDGFLVDANLSYITQKLKASSLDPGATAPPFGNNPAGVLPNDPPVVPKWKFNVGAQYEYDLANAGSITPRVDVSYQDKQYTGPSTIAGVRTLNFIPSFTTVNARLTWQNADKDLDISLQVQNLTNEYYFLSLFDLRGAGAGFRKGLPAAPREWAVSVKKKF